MTSAISAESYPHRSEQRGSFNFSGTTLAWIIFLVIFVAYTPVYGLVDGPYLQGILSFGFMVVTVFLMYRFAKIDPRTWPWRRWLVVGVFVIGYFVAGAAHSVVRWHFYSSEWRTNYDRLIQVYAKDKNITLTQDKETGTWQVPAENVKDWQHRYRYAYKVGPKPNYLDFEWKIKQFLFQWPWSLAHWLIWDWLLEVFNMIYNLLGTTYEWIASRYTRGTQ